MGRVQVEEMLALTSQDQALEWHLQYNHYPPVHPIFFESAKEAIRLANQEDYDTVIILPNEKRLTVSAIIEGLHLDSFIAVDLL